MRSVSAAAADTSSNKTGLHRKELINHPTITTSSSFLGVLGATYVLNLEPWII
jgi:hypothetical protein